MARNACNSLIQIFPRSKERGLIEACFSCGGYFSYYRYFPRSKERGLIEAQRLGSLPNTVSIFPRSKERGLIEAQPRRRMPRSRPRLSAFERARPH